MSVLNEVVLAGRADTLRGDDDPVVAAGAVGPHGRILGEQWVEDGCAAGAEFPDRLIRGERVPQGLCAFRPLGAGGERFALCSAHGGEGSAAVVPVANVLVPPGRGQVLE